MTLARRALGQSGEAAVAEWYAARGYRVLDRNWRCRTGEIDVVLRAADGTLVFCEVKARTSDAFGLPAEAVTGRKQAKLRSLAAQWMAAHPGRGRSVRFDVASVLGGLIEVLEGAF